MTDDALLVLVALTLVFVINLVPAFMPSTWMVLALFYIRYDLPLLVLTIGGAIVSGFGRLLLARGSAAFRRRFMRAKAGDLEELGIFLEERRNYAGLAVFGYSLLPLPTNNLFIAAGMVGVSLAWVLVGFWAARMIADTFWVWAAERTYDSVDDLLRGAVGSWTALALQIASLTSIVLLYRLPWARWLRRVTGGRPRPGAPTAPTG